MYCKYCGKETEGERDVCTNCENERKQIKEVSQEQDVKKEETNQEEVIVQTTNIQQENQKAQVANQNTETSNQAQTNSANTEEKAKSKLAAGLFGIFLGVFGVHNFYLGYTGKAIAQLLITILTCGVFSFVSALWGLIEGILILTGDIDKDGRGNSLRE